MTPRKLKELHHRLNKRFDLGPHPITDKANTPIVSLTCRELEKLLNYVEYLEEERKDETVRRADSLKHQSELEEQKRELLAKIRG